MSEKIGRNDPCRCGSGKKYKRCCLPGDDSNTSFDREDTLLQGASGQRSTASASSGRFERLLDRAGEALAYPWAIAWIFGIQMMEGENAFRLVQCLREEAEKARRRGILLGPEKISSMSRKLLSIIDQAEERKALWKKGVYAPMKVRCPDDEVYRMANQIKADGFVELTKRELEERFDLSRAVRGWAQIPGYTRINLHGGLGFVSPEAELFRSMCWLNNETLRTGRDMDDRRRAVASGDADVDAYESSFDVHRTMCRQTVVSAFLVVEAYLNGLASAFLANRGDRLSEKERLWLQERARKPSGVEYQRFVKTDEKLHGWIKLMSPRDETFDKGRDPFQGFIRIKKYRDALVHMAEEKVLRFWSVDAETAGDAADTASRIIEHISRCLAPDPDRAEYPFWFVPRQADGTFELPRVLRMERLEGASNDTGR